MLRLRAGAGPVLLALALVAASRAGAALGVVPALGLLRGPLGFVLLAAALTLLVSPRAWERIEDALARVSDSVLALVAGAVFALTGLHYAAGLHPAGDEPHYLLMAQSLAREGDLDLRDNFERGDFREYVPDLAAPHYGAPRADGRPFPAHSPGLPALLAPAYALGGRRACVLLMACLAALGVAQARALARQLGAGPRAAAFAALAACGPPLGLYAFHLYTEVPSALALALGLRLLLGEADPRPRRALAAAVLAALAASALPWLHVKMIPAALALGGIALARLRGRPRGAFVAVSGVAALGFVAYYVSIFGQATPLALYGGGVPRGVEPAPWRAAAGLLLDRSFGLLPFAPVFVLALAGVPAWLAALGARDARRAAAWSHALVALAVLAPVLAWRMWWGGMCPPARFVVPIVPTLAALVALRVDGAARGLSRARWPLLGAGAALFVFMIARPPDLLALNRGDRPTRAWNALAGESLAGAVSLGDYLPSLVFPSAGQARLAGAWLVGLAALLLLDTRSVRGTREPARGERGLG